MHNPFRCLMITDYTFKQYIWFNIKLVGAGCFVLLIIFAPAVVKRILKKNDYEEDIVKQLMTINKDKGRTGK